MSPLRMAGQAPLSRHTCAFGSGAGRSAALGSRHPRAPQRRARARRLFAGTVLAGLAPGALLLTGDLVDGKTAIGRGHQLKPEWEARTCVPWATCGHHSPPIALLLLFGVSPLAGALADGHERRGSGHSSRARGRRARRNAQS